MASLEESTSIVQLKVRLLDISPMIWRRVLVPESVTLRELHGILQVGMGWENMRLYYFDVHAVRYGSLDLSAADPDIALSRFGLYAGERFAYLYDMGDFWKHEVHVEKLLERNPKKTYPVCTGGAGVCPPEDFGGASGYLKWREEATGSDARSRLLLIAGFEAGVRKGRPSRMLTDDDREAIENALERMAARAPFLETTFSRGVVNQEFRDGRHLRMIRQQLP